MTYRWVRLRFLAYVCTDEVISHDQQAAWLSCGKIDVALVVGKGESIRHFLANDLENIPERVLSKRQKSLKLTPKSGDGQTEKPKCDRPPYLGAKNRYNG